MYGANSQPDTGDARLDEALYSLASVFGRNRGSKNWGETNDSSVTLTYPVWDLSEEDYRDFCGHAPFRGDAANTVTAIKYFLPRVVADLVAGGERHRDVPWSAPHLASLLSEHGWKNWNMDEIMALHGWATAWLRYSILHNHALLHEDDTILIAAVLEVNLSAAFDEAKLENPLNAMRWFARQIESHWQSLMATGWPIGWQRSWGDRSVGLREAESFVWFLLDAWRFRELQEEALRTSDQEMQALFWSAHQHGTHCLEAGKGEPNSPMRNPPSIEIDFFDIQP